MDFVQQSGSNLFVGAVTIAAGESVSELFDTHGFALVGILMPAAWDAAKLRLNAAIASDGTPVPVKKTNGVEWQVEADVDQYITLVGEDVAYAPYLQLLSDNGAGVAVAQTAARTLTLVLRRYLS